MKIVKIIAVTLTAIITALIVLPLTILAGLFVWLKLTEENEEDFGDLELEDVG